MPWRTSELLAFLTKAGPRSAPSGWALALDAAIAVGATAGAVVEVTVHTVQATIVTPEATFVTQTVTEHASAGTLAAAVLTTLPLAARRLYPITVWLVIVSAALALGTGVPTVTFGAVVFAAYSAVVHSRYRNLAIVMVLAVTVVVTTTVADTLPRFPGRLTALFVIVPAAAAGLGLRELRRRLNVSAAEHEAATQRAIEAERARIAGELHDVVTHNVSVMVVQAGAARKILATSPGEAEEALLSVEASGRTAMAELRNLLGLLSPAGDDGANAALRPQPGLGELGALVDRVSAAGLPVSLDVSGAPWPLSPGADLAAYRVIQEALTNVLRHAGESAASVRIEWEEKLVITVCDDGHGTVKGAGEAGRGPAGRGLLGLRERLSLYGGTLDAGPRPSGGWQVRVVMPVEAAS